MNTPNENSPEALSIALFAVVYEAKALGMDVDAICAKFRDGLFDGAKPYRGGSAIGVTPAQNAIKAALSATKDCSPT